MSVHTVLWLSLGRLYETKTDDRLTFRLTNRRTGRPMKATESQLLPEKELRKSISEMFVLCIMFSGCSSVHLESRIYKFSTRFYCWKVNVTQRILSLVLLNWHSSCAVATSTSCSVVSKPIHVTEDMSTRSWEEIWVQIWHFNKDLLSDYDLSDHIQNISFSELFSKNAASLVLNLGVGLPRGYQHD